MIRNTLRRFLSLALSAVMLLALLPAISAPALAAVSGTLTGLSNEDIIATYTGTDDGANSSWSVTGGNSISGSVIGTAGMCSDSHYNTTLTLTNNKPTEAILSFDYAIAQNSGSIQVAGTTVTANGSYSNTIAPGGTIKVYLASGSTSNATKITITNLNLIVDVQTKITFQPAENGSYTVNGEEPITTETVKTGQSTTPYNLNATPNGGYKFVGWYSVTNDKYLSSEASASLNFDSDQTVTAVFTAVDTPVFDVSGARFYDLNDANAYASSSGINKISLVSDGILSAGDYTISSGVILLIPFDAANTCYTTAPATTGNSRTAPSVYRKLTMDTGANITVNGAISVSAKHYAYSQGGASGAPDGKYGYIYMNEGSSIVINNGGALYVYGFISGKGTVTAESGATVYEYMQIADFRGGSATMGMYKNGQKIFPINQYFIQNIEAELTLHSGADEYIYTSIYASDMSTSTSVHFIGNTDAMFSVAEGGYLTKKYVPDQDRTEIGVYGDGKVDSLTLTLISFEISSGNYVLPINNSLTLKAMEGTTTINQDMALLAGAQMYIAEGATIQVTGGNSLYVYDRDEWTQANYASNAKFKKTPYSPTRTYNRTNDDLVDARIDVNGTLQVDGAIYTTAGGADIVSSQGTGRVILTNGAGSNTATYMYKDYTSNYDTIPITSAKLHNGNAEEPYTLTDGAGSGTTYNYCTKCDKWYTGIHNSVTFYVNGMEAETICTASDNTATYILETEPVKVVRSDNGVAPTYAEGTLTVSNVTDGMRVDIYTKAVVAQIVDGDMTTQYISLADAVTAYSAREQAEGVENDAGLPYIQLLADSTEPGFAIDKDVYLDLNGKTVTLTGESGTGTLTINEGATLYGMDSATEDYSDARYGKIVGTVSGTGKVAVAHETYRLAGGKVRRYVSYQNENELSFHRYNMSVTSYEFHFRANGQCDMDFGATFRGSSTVVQLLKDMGFKVVESNIVRPGWWSEQYPNRSASQEIGEYLGRSEENPYILRGTLINIGADQPKEFTKYYDIYALLKFQDNTVVESVPRNLNYLWALKQYYKSSDATDDEKAVINAFLEKNSLQAAWDSIN